jgi:MoxR-like ATPase
MRTCFFDAMIVGLSGRIHVDEAAKMTAEQVLREIWEDRFIITPHTAGPD